MLSTPPPQACVTMCEAGSEHKGLPLPTDMGTIWLTMSAGSSDSSHAECGVLTRPTLTSLPAPSHVEAHCQQAALRVCELPYTPPHVLWATKVQPWQHGFPGGEGPMVMHSQAEGSRQPPYFREGSRTQLKRKGRESTAPAPGAALAYAHDKWCHWCHEQLYLACSIPCSVPCMYYALHLACAMSHHVHDLRQLDGDSLTMIRSSWPSLEHFTSIRSGTAGEVIEPHSLHQRWLLVWSWQFACKQLSRGH